mmetsp:Transcript_39099/g.112940  ORF Transcript_39099/g.112940 Transcript_39099/m.112940 type:complete len:169 (-) Transcript_39099:302-808(-)
MKPDWDKLTAAYKDHATTLVADVDCTAGGKSLCAQVGVRGYPTIKHGDPSDLQDYKGGRDFASLKKFADALGPQCGPASIDLCDDAKKAMIKEFQAMSSEDRQKLIKERENESASVEAEYKTFVDRLQKEYQELQDKKDKDIEEVRNSGLGLLKSVHAHAKKVAKSEL